MWVVSTQTMSACLNRLNIPTNELHWIYVPESADQLHTEENYFFMAGSQAKLWMQAPALQAGWR
jgi:hypothetical protein